jgi:cob(I)alamin adenosyltransferase
MAARVLGNPYGDGMPLFTGKGDDGTTGLLFGGRVRKDSAVIEAAGAVDEAQAAIGVARAGAQRGSEVDELLVSVEHDLYVLGAELATAPANRAKLVADTTLVTATMVAKLEQVIEDIGARFPMPTEFVLPGQDPMSAALEVARTVVRRAERLVVPVAAEDSQVVPYLNRLSSLMWAMARWQEHGDSLPSRTAARM